MRVTLRDRVGTKGKNKYGSIMEVIEYNSYSDIFVRFNNGYTVHTNWKAFELGKVSNPYDKSVYGTGYIGEGAYSSFKNNKITPQYDAWSSMIVRCYGKHDERYENCTVCEEWHNYQNFAKWYDNNFYQLNNERMELDKDILIKGNKMYSPESCVFVPRYINCLFTKTDKFRGNLPIGVSIENKTGKYRARCNNGKKVTIYLGLYKTPIEAFYAYKKYKEKTIKQIAEDHKHTIPIELYNALITYEVEITD